jgi:hypothetical protein
MFHFAQHDMESHRYFSVMLTAGKHLIVRAPNAMCSASLHCIISEGEVMQ